MPGEPDAERPMLGCDSETAIPAQRDRSDPHDFAALYIRHRSSFAAQARRMLTDPRDVEDVVQEAFLRLFLALPELETELQTLAYCRRTVANLCIDRYRADARRPRLVDLDAAPDVVALAEDDPVVRAEDAAIVRDALARLTPAHRAALVKHEMEEKSIRTVARELGVPETTVKHLLYRARRALRRALLEKGVAPDRSGEAARVPQQRSPAGVVGAVVAVVALLLVGVVCLDAASGLRPGPGRVAAAPHLPPALVPDHADPPAVGPAALPGRRAKAARRPDAGQSPSPATKPSLSAPVVSTSPVTFAPPGTRVAGAADAPYLLSGAYRDVPARISSQQRQQVAADRMESVSRFEAATPAGTFTLDQHLVFALDRESPAVADSSLIVSLPVEGGANAFRSDTATVSMEGDFGAPVFVHVQADVTQVSFHGPDTGATSARLDVQTAYAADWVTVTAQHVTVTLPGELATSSVATGHNESAANNPYAAWRAIDANGILSRTSLDFTERRRT